jgi:hypothetical protein
MEAMTHPDPSHAGQPPWKSRVLPPPEPWLEEWVTSLWESFPEIEQIYVLGDRARGPQGQKPDYSLLLYAGYDRALELMTTLAREEDKRRASDGIIHLYIENYGATFCGIWGGALIPNEYNNDWEEGHDYVLWKERGSAARPLRERLRLPLERRQTERRRIDTAVIEDAARDRLQPLWPESENRERRGGDRRRAYTEWLPLLDSA